VICESLLVIDDGPILSVNNSLSTTVKSSDVPLSKIIILFVSDQFPTDFLLLTYLIF
jgi:hypothetical protein